MRIFNKVDYKSDRGFTLVELAVVFIIVGIIAALAAPNFIAMLNRFYVIESIDKLNGAIKETQRQAMLQGKVCRVNINPITSTITGNPTNCLLSDRNIRQEIKIRTNLSGSLPSISFSGRGSTTKMGTIVVSEDTTNFQKCFVISLGIGITRTGDYIGNKTDSVSAAKCRPD